MNRTRGFTWCVAIICCCCFSGCASLITNGIKLETAGEAEPYMGVRADAAGIKKALTSPPSFTNFIGGLLVALDLPMSAVLDTLLLPLSIFDQKDEREINLESAAERLPDHNASPNPKPKLSDDELN